MEEAAPMDFEAAEPLVVVPKDEETLENADNDDLDNNSFEVTTAVEKFEENADFHVEETEDFGDDAASTPRRSDRRKLESPRKRMRPPPAIPTRPFDIPDAPTFYPSAEEFKEPLRYIEHIRPEAEKAGICKIVPPADWRPPFVLDTKKFRFKTRLQRLNSMEGETRSRLHYLDGLMKFHAQQGKGVQRLPRVNKRPLDLYRLRKEVHKRGGYQKACLERTWPDVVEAMELRGKEVAFFSAVCRNNYLRLIRPYEIYLFKQRRDRAAREPGVDLPADTLGLLEELVGDEYDRTVGDGDDDGPIFDAPDSPRAAAPPVNEDDGEMIIPISWSIPVSMPDPPSGPTSPSKNASSTRLQALLASMREDPIETEPDTTGMVLSEGFVDDDDDKPAIGDLDGEPVGKVLSDDEGPDGPDTRARKFARKLRSKGKIKAGAASRYGPHSRYGGQRVRRALPAGYVARPGEELCEVCAGGEDTEQMLLCDGCNRGTHLYCLIPPLESVPESDWYCPDCLANVGGDYGFEDGQEYNINDFRAMADAFKRKWFGKWMPADPASKLPPKKKLSMHFVPPDSQPIDEDMEARVETQFWNLISSPYQDVTVEYGADLHSSIHGSGFPRLGEKLADRARDEFEQKYRSSGWNLNNIPVTKESIFQHIKSDISGMMIPWLYVGMTFSSFCWHAEDHYSYSVNYNHWGDTKTWYGIPAKHADKFEQVMREALPELFESQPDLLFHLVTLLSPGVLSDRGVEVNRINQRPGEFVVTFPNAYHCGFNHGFNFAEAVNFAPAAWLPYGRRCVNRYHKYKKLPVFSHHELVCAAAAETNQVYLASWLREELETMVQNEMAGRAKLMKKMPTVRVDYVPKGMPEAVTCAGCNDYLFLSAFKCTCNPRQTCASHFDQLCKCSGEHKTLYLRYNESDFNALLKRVNDLAERPEQWKSRYETLFAPAPDGKKPALRAVQALWDDKKLLVGQIPDSQPLDELMVKANEILSEAAKFTRKHVPKGEKHTKRTLEQLDELIGRAHDLFSESSEIDQLSNIANNARSLRSQAQAQLSNPDATPEDMLKLVRQVEALEVTIPELPPLQERARSAQWCYEAEAAISTDSMDGATVKELLDTAGDRGITKTDALFVKLETLYNEAEAWNFKVETALSRKKLLYLTIPELEELVHESRKLPVDKDLVTKLSKTIHGAKSWMNKINDVVAELNLAESGGAAKGEEEGEEEEDAESADGQPKKEGDVKQEGAATSMDVSHGPLASEPTTPTAGTTAAFSDDVESSAAPTPHTATSQAGAAFPAVGTVEEMDTGAKSEPQTPGATPTAESLKREDGTDVACEGGSAVAADTPRRGAQKKRKRLSASRAGASPLRPRASARARSTRQRTRGPRPPLTFRNVKALLREAREMPVKLAGPTLELKSQVARVQEWVREAKALFLPRTLRKATDIFGDLLRNFALAAGRPIPKRLRSEDDDADDDLPENLPGQPPVKDDFHVSYYDESLDHRDLPRYCVCRDFEGGFMIECDYCKEWYHGKCVGVVKQDMELIVRYACPVCDVTEELRHHRTEVPVLEDVETLLEKATHLPIRHESADQLQMMVSCLREWMQKVNAVFAKPISYPQVKELRDLLRVGESMEIEAGNELEKLREKLGELAPLWTERRDPTPEPEAEPELEPLEGLEDEEEPSDDRLYCICKRPYDKRRPMVSCDTCQDWFHYKCVRISPEEAADAASYCCPRCSAQAGWDYKYGDVRVPRDDSRDLSPPSRKRRRSDAGEGNYKPSKKAKRAAAAAAEREIARDAMNNTGDADLVSDAAPASSRGRASKSSNDGSAERDTKEERREKDNDKDKAKDKEEKRERKPKSDKPKKSKKKAASSTPVTPAGPVFKAFVGDECFSPVSATRSLPGADTGVASDMDVETPASRAQRAVPGWVELPDLLDGAPAAKRMNGPGGERVPHLVMNNGHGLGLVLQKADASHPSPLAASLPPAASTPTAAAAAATAAVAEEEDEVVEEEEVVDTHAPMAAEAKAVVEQPAPAVHVDAAASNAPNHVHGEAENGHGAPQPVTAMAM